MRCDQTEIRLNALLDSRQPLDSDADLASHLTDCLACAELADTYAAMQRYGRPIDARVDVASRVVAASTGGGGKNPPGSGGLARWLPHWAVAAAVLISATTISFIANRPPDGQPIDLPMADAPVDPVSPAPEAIVESPAPQLEGGLWATTGRTLATLPLAVLSPEAGNETTPSMQELMEWGRQWLPANETDSASPSGETGHFFSSTAAVAV